MLQKCGGGNSSTVARHKEITRYINNQRESWASRYAYSSSTSARHMTRLKKYSGATAEGMVESALRHVEMLQSCDFHRIKISLKASDVGRTVAAYRLLSRKTDFPLHVGVTEAGGIFPGIVKSALGSAVVFTANA